MEISRRGRVNASSTHEDRARLQDTQADALHVTVARRAERRVTVNQLRAGLCRNGSALTQQRALQPKAAVRWVSRCIREITNVVTNEQLRGRGCLAVDAGRKQAEARLIEPAAHVRLGPVVMLA